MAAVTICSDFGAQEDSQDGYGYLFTFVLPCKYSTNFKVTCSSSVKNAIGILIKIALNL